MYQACCVKVPGWVLGFRVRVSQGGWDTMGSVHILLVPSRQRSRGRGLNTHTAVEKYQRRTTKCILSCRHTYSYYAICGQYETKLMIGKRTWDAIECERAQSSRRMTGMHNFKKPRQLQDRLGKAVEDFCQYSGLIYSDPFPTVFFLERIKPTNTSHLPHTQIPLKVDIVSRHEYSSNLVDILTVLSVCVFVRPEWTQPTVKSSVCAPQRLRAIVVSLTIHSAVPAGSLSRGGDFAIYVFDINQPSLRTPFYSVLVSVSVFMALATVFHFINSPDNSPLSHSVLPVLFLPYLSFQLYISSRKSPFSPAIILCGWLGLKAPAD